MSDTPGWGPGPPPPGGWQQPGPSPGSGGWQQPGPPPGGQQSWGGPPPGGPGWAPRAQAPKPGVIPLRPLGVGEILDGAISYIRAHPKVTLGLAAVVLTLTQLIQVPTQYLLLGSLDSLASPSGPMPTPGDLAAVAAGASGAALLSAVVSFVAVTILTGLLIVVVSQSVMGRPVTFAETWATARPRLLGLIGLTILTALIIGAVVLVCAAPAVVAGVAGAPIGAVIGLGVLGFVVGFCLVVYLYVALSMAAPVYMLERTAVVAALSRSRRLVNPQWWRIFGILLLAGLIAGVISLIISVPFTLAGGFSGAVFGADPDPLAAPSLLALALGAIGTILASTITAPFTAGVTGLLYIDQRMRREALDLELARITAAPYGQPGAPPSPAW